MQISRRQQGTFTNQRGLVYRIFEDYLKLKQVRAGWDVADMYVVCGTRVDLIGTNQLLCLESMRFGAVCAVKAHPGGKWMPCKSSLPQSVF